MASGQQLNRLTHLAVQNLSEPGWHPDGGGLYLQIGPTGSKRWTLRVRTDGRTREFGLGPLHKVPLKAAREAATEYRAKLYKGIDPVAEKRARKVVAPRVAPTFEACAKEVHRLRKAQLKNAKHIQLWINQLVDYAFPVMRTKPIDTVTTADVLAVLSPIWASKPETARRIRQRLRIIFDWARASGHRSGDNPVDLIGEALPRQRNTKRHLAALPYGEVKTFIAQMRASNADPMSKLAFEFLILTAARSQEVRLARRDEINTERTLWTIPGDDPITGRGMKSGREHIVPLVPRMLEILDEAKALMPENELCFPDRQSGRAMSENRFLVLRDALGYTQRCTPHGFRSSFRDWAAEETNFSSEVAEMALAHRIKSKTEAAYRRGHLLAKRRELMTAWASYVCASPS